MNAIATKTTYTPEELLAMPDGKNYELVDGHLVERKVSTLSSWVAGQLHRYLDESLRQPATRLGISGGHRLPVLPGRSGQSPQARCLVHPQ